MYCAGNMLSLYIVVYISETNSIVVYTTYREKAVSDADGLEETYGGVRWNDF